MANGDGHEERTRLELRVVGIHKTRRTVGIEKSAQKFKFDIHRLIMTCVMRGK